MSAMFIKVVCSPGASCLEGLSALVVGFDARLQTASYKFRKVEMVGVDFIYP